MAKKVRNAGQHEETEENERPAEKESETPETGTPTDRPEQEAPAEEGEKPKKQGEVALQPGKILIDSVQVDEDIAKEVDVFAQRAEKLAVIAFRADKAQEKAKKTVNEDFLQIARDCKADLRLFNQSCILAQYRFKATHKVAKVPRLWTQVQSNIRYILENGKFVNVSIEAVDPETKKPYTLTKLRNLIKKREEDQTRQTGQEIASRELAATPQYVKDFEEIISAMRIEAQIKEGTWREEFRPMVEATSFMRDTLKAWRDQYKEEEEEEKAETQEAAAQ